MVKVFTGNLGERRLAPQFEKYLPRGAFSAIRERTASPVSAIRNKEVDEFDDEDSVYLLTTDQDNDVIGGWRLRPTTRPYMLSKVFPELLYGEAAPVGRTIWEISRFAVERSDTKGPSYGMGGASRALVMETMRFAMRHGVSQYVMVVSVSLERLLRSFGLKMHRFGPPIRIGRVMSVALWLDVDIHTRSILLGEPIPMLAAA
jgi:acyl homoserine lactone synthase